MEKQSARGAESHSGIERRVATILHADIAGYSRLMGENEERTVRVFREHREVFESLVKMHRGRIFNTAGDALLAEFPSSVEAVRCATEIQAALHTRNEHLSPKERLQFRIGINLGDVIVQGGDLLGDGVNVAARVQTAAEPGGISISGSVYDQIQNKLSLNFQPLGEKTFKNIQQAVRTYSIVFPDSARTASRGPWRLAGVGIAGVLVITAACYAGYQEYSRQQAAEATRQAAVETARKAEEEKRRAELTARRQAAEEEARKRAETANREAMLLAQRQAAEEAARKAAEAVKREAAALAQRQAAEEAAARKAVDERRRLEEERRAVAAERKAAEARANATQAPSIMAAARSGTDVARFDGTYLGRICNHFRYNPDDPKNIHCWRVSLQVQNGKLTGSWKSGVTGEPSWVRGTITSDGAVSAMMEGWHRKTKLPVSASLGGQWVDQEIKVAGAWAAGGRVSAMWKRAP